MFTRGLSLVAALVLSPFALAGQHVESPGAGARPPREASQYDFLVGQWSLTVTPRMSGLVALIHGVPRLRGSWKGARALDGWGEEDELRITDESGNPIAYFHFTRIYDPASKHWLVSSIDVNRQRLATSSSQLVAGEMLSLSVSTDSDDKPYRSRTHVTDITPTSFHYSQDVSHDSGATWEEGHLIIDAKRVTTTSPP